MHAPACAGDQAVKVGGQHQLAPVDDQDVVDGLRHLREHMAGDEDRLTLRSEAPQELAEPMHAFGIQTVGRLVEDQKLGIAEQRGGEPEALPHSKGVAPDPSSSGPLKLYERQNLLDATRRQVCGVCQHQQVIAARAARMEVGRLQDRTNAAGGVRNLLVRHSEDERSTAARPGEPEQHA